MSLKKKAAQVRAKGSKNVGEDSVLAHISPKEAMLLKMRGGSGQPDPNTGLPHFNENGDGGMGGSMGDGGIDTGSGGGFDSGGGWAAAGGFTGAGLGSMGGYQGYDPGTPNADFGGVPGGYTGFGFSGYDGGYGFDLNQALDTGGFNSAMDSQQANSDLGLGPVSSYDGTVDLGSVSSPGMSMADLGRKGAKVGAGLLGGLPGLALNAGLAATSKDPGKGFGSMAGSTVGGIAGSAIGGPIGGFLGSQLGGFLGGRGLSGTGASTADAAAGIAAGKEAGNSGNTGGFDLGGVLTGLAGLYQGTQANQVNQTAVNNNNTAGQFAQQQAQTLADMYGPNSPYAAQLRQQLERKDAAAGRRSQYGPREVELQARLADIQARNAPNILNANRQFMDANKEGIGYKQASNKVNGQQLASIMSLANKTGITDWAQKGLKDIFNNGTTGTVSNLPSDLGVFTPGSGYSNAPAPTGNGDSGGNFWDNWEF